ncbi:hypothetical protein VTN00DRAFT_122 [Thermoascus crustaceus]|uniref:uncharacterized protein n=1 Tax=Thermoascus crustaceus TaxID=5088 RepID=UPI0037431FC7
MTDTSSVATTHPTTEPYPVTAPLNSPVPNGAVSDSIPPEDDEPYTIKCICAFEDDDGNTVFCEGCETWQHIECYYHGRDVPEVHNCVDCEPRPLDGKRATERQRRLREQSDGGDRKSKRSGTKSQKKKAKDHYDQVNGYHHRSESNSRDQPPAKKPKTSHKPSGSVGSLSGAPPLQPDSRKRTGSISMSPTKSSGPSIPLYSSDFLHLYERDQKHVHMESNLFVNLTLAADLASWVKDPSALSRVVNGRTQDVFTRSDASLDPTRWPSLTLHSFTDTSVEYDGKHPTFKVLRTEEGVRNGAIVGEVKGKIGLLRDYCLDPHNRWQELRHPEPFVFFHPQLPIYIDSRDEGTMLRYVRRSCHPNVTMKTFITNEVEYHFCFVATQDIPAHSEITAMWYLDQQLVGSANGLMKQESSDGVQDAAAICLSNVLANFGGCACDLGEKCLLFHVDRRSRPKAIDSSTKQLNGKRKKAKSKQNNSPLGTGQATNSRAGSEGVKNQHDDDQADGRSTSGSARGQTRSRDLTPTHQTQNDVLADSELSARDKRKIAAVEKKFEQLEQDQTARKKKRGSGQSTQTTPTVAGSKQACYFANQGAQSKSLHLDTGAGRQSRSPPSRLSPGSPSVAHNVSPRKTSGSNTPVVRSPLGRPQYVDSAIQTDPDEHDVRYVPPTPQPRRSSFVPLTQRLLKRCHEDRVKFEEMGRQRDAFASSTSSGSRPTSSSTASSDGIAGKPVLNEKNDVEMKDVHAGMTPSQSGVSETGGQLASPESNSLSPSVPGSGTKPPPPPWPSTAAHNSIITGQTANGVHSDHDRPDAKTSTIQLPPTTISSLPAASTPGTTTPSLPQSTSGLESPLSQPGVQTPGSGVAAPSPVKKKLSLGDYLSRRGNLTTTPTSEKTQAQATTMLPPQKAPVSQSPAASSPTPATKGTQVQTNATATVYTEKRESPSPPDVPMEDVAEPPLSPSVSSISPLSRQPKIQPPS